MAWDPDEYTSAERSANAKKQLRDRVGRWIEMGGGVKWYSTKLKKHVYGTARDIKGENVVVEVPTKSGNSRKVEVSGSKVEAINAKAKLSGEKAQQKGKGTLPPGYSKKPQNGISTESAEPKKKLSLQTNPTHYQVGTGDNTAITTPVSELEVGDEVYPIFQANKAYNSKKSYSGVGIPKSASGVGEVVKIKEGKYATIRDPEGKEYYIGNAHHVVKRTPEIDQRLQDGMAAEKAKFGENSSSGQGTQWMKDLLVEEDAELVEEGVSEATDEESAEAPQAETETTEEAPTTEAQTEEPSIVKTHGDYFELPEETKHWGWQLKEGDKVLWTDANTVDGVAYDENAEIQQTNPYAYSPFNNPLGAANNRAYVKMPEAYTNPVNQPGLKEQGSNAVEVGTIVNIPKQKGFTSKGVKSAKGDIYGIREGQSVIKADEEIIADLALIQSQKDFPAQSEFINSPEDADSEPTQEELPVSEDTETTETTPEAEQKADTDASETTDEAESTSEETEPQNASENAETDTETSEQEDSTETESEPAAETDTPETTEDEKAEQQPETEEAVSTPVALEGEKFPPTLQQQAVIDAVLAGKDTLVQAKAGAGKTTTLEAISRRLQIHRPKDQVAYIAFNKSVQLEANKRMPDNVESRTGHAVAYNWAPEWMQNRSKDKGNKALRRPDEIADHLGITDTLNVPGDDNMGPEEQAMAAVRTVDTFANSAEDTVGEEHLPESLADMPDDVKKAVLGHAQAVWEDISSEDGEIKFSLDHMRKHWALSKPDFSKDGSGLGKKADVLFLDEAQDTPPVLAKVVADQNIQKVIVGDADQAIYGFTGATDYLSTAEGDIELPLNKSWRFGPAIADAGNRFLQLLKSKGRVVGAGGESKITEGMADPDAILVRSNAGMLAEIANELGNGKTVGVPTKTKGDLKSLIASARYLKKEGPAPSKMHDDLAQYRSWKEVEKAAEKGDDPKATMISGLFKEKSSWELNKLVDQVVEDSIPLTFREMDHGTIVEGDTYPLYQTLKGAGLKWMEIPGEINTTGKNAGKPKKAWTILGSESAVNSKIEEINELVPKPSKPDVTVSTAHKAKGLEWDRVKIGSDFKGPKKDKKTGKVTMPDPEELRLAYVAVTRAQKELDPGSLGYVYDHTFPNGGEPDVSEATEEAPESAMPQEEPVDIAETPMEDPTVEDIAKGVDDVVENEEALAEEEPVIDTTPDFDVNTVPEIEDAEIPDVSGWKKLSNSSGSNPGGVYEAPNGEKFFIKQSQTDSHAKNEVLADKFYREVGIETANLSLANVDGNGKLGTIAPFIEGASGDLKKKLATDPEYRAEFQEGYAMDAWLANWDTVGLVYDNAVTGPDGNPIRVDPGGSMIYRAQGSKKTAAMFPDTVGEWETMRFGDNTSSEAFGDMTDEQLIDSVAKVEAISEQRIDELIDSVEFDEETASFLKDKMKARRQDLIAKADALKPEEVDEPEPETVPVGETPADALTAEQVQDNYDYNWSRFAEQLVPSNEFDDVIFNQEDRTEAVNYYLGAGFDKINKALRNGTGLNPYNALKKSALDDSFDKHGTDVSGQTLYTGHVGDWVSNLEEGSVVSYDGFRSTSTSPDVAEQFSGVGFDGANESGAIFEFVAPDGTTGLDMEQLHDTLGLEDKYFGPETNEHEILLPRGAKLTVTQITESGDSDYPKTITAELSFEGESNGEGQPEEAEETSVPEESGTTESPASSDETGAEGNESEPEPAEEVTSEPASVGEQSSDPFVQAYYDALNTTFPDKGKTVTNANGDVLKPNMIVSSPKFGEGVISKILPSTDAAKVIYKHIGEKVTQAKHLSVFDPNGESETEAEPLNYDELNIGDSGINPENGQTFIVGKNKGLIHVGNKVSYTKKGVTTEGTVESIYKGTETVKVAFDDGTTSVKKASKLERLPDVQESTPTPEPQVQETTPEPEPQPEPEPTPIVPDSITNPTPDDLDGLPAGSEINSIGYGTTFTKMNTGNWLSESPTEIVSSTDIVQNYGDDTWNYTPGEGPAVPSPAAEELDINQEPESVEPNVSGTELEEAGIGSTLYSPAHDVEFTKDKDGDWEDTNGKAPQSWYTSSDVLAEFPDDNWQFEPKSMEPNYNPSELDYAPEFSEIYSPTHQLTFQKENGVWADTQSGEEYTSDGLLSEFPDDDWSLNESNLPEGTIYMPGTEFVSDLPLGSIIQQWDYADDSSSTYVKVGEDKWQGMGHDEKLVNIETDDTVGDDGFIHVDFVGNGSREYVETEFSDDTYYQSPEDITSKWVENLPVGTKLKLKQDAFIYYEKQGDDAWNAYNKYGQLTQEMSSGANEKIEKAQAYGGAYVDEPVATAPTAESYPLGTYVPMHRSVTTGYTKTGENEWDFQLSGESTGQTVTDGLVQAVLDKNSPNVVVPEVGESSSDDVGESLTEKSITEYSEQDFDALPVGAVINRNSPMFDNDKAFWSKNADGDWTFHTNNGALGNENITSQEMSYMFDSNSVSDPTFGEPLDIEAEELLDGKNTASLTWKQFYSLPVGTELTLPNTAEGAYEYKKSADNTWVIGESENTISDSQFQGVVETDTGNSGFTIHIPKETTPIAEFDGKNAADLTWDQFTNLPVGSVASFQNGATYNKVAEDTWHYESIDTSYPINDSDFSSFVGGSSSTLPLHLSWPEQETSNTPEESGLEYYDGKSFSELPNWQIPNLPIGSKIHMNGTGIRREKIADDAWQTFLTSGNPSSFAPSGDNLIDTLHTNQGEAWTLELPKSDSNASSPQPQEEPLADWEKELLNAGKDAEAPYETYNGKSFADFPTDEIPNLPIGTQLIKPSSVIQVTRTKIGENQWETSTNGEVLSLVLLDDADIKNTQVNSGNEYIVAIPESVQTPPTPPTPEPVTDEYPITSMDQLSDVPSQTYITNNKGDIFQKTGAVWTPIDSEGNSKNWVDGDSYAVNSELLNGSGFSYFPEGSNKWKVIENPFESSSTASDGPDFEEKTENGLTILPVGTVIVNSDGFRAEKSDGYGNNMWRPQDSSGNYIKYTDGDDLAYSHELINNQGSSWKVYEPGQVPDTTPTAPTPKSEYPLNEYGDLENLPNGTYLTNAKGEIFYKEHSSKYVPYNSNGNVIDYHDGSGYAVAGELLQSSHHTGGNEWKVVENPFSQVQSAPTLNTPQGVFTGVKIDEETLANYPIGTTLKTEKNNSWNPLSNRHIQKMDDGTWHVFQKSPAGKLMNKGEISPQSLANHYYYFGNPSSTATVSVPQADKYFKTNMGELGYVGDTVKYEDGNEYTVTKVNKTSVKAHDANGTNHTLDAKKVQSIWEGYGKKHEQPSAQYSPDPDVLAANQAAAEEAAKKAAEQAKKDAENAVSNFAGAQAEEYNEQDAVVPSIETPLNDGITVADNGEPDPTDPLYGTPEPTAPVAPSAYPSIEEKQQEDLPKWDSAEWLEAMKQRYLDNPNKAQASLEQSNNWAKVKNVVDMDDNWEAALDKLLSSQYASEELYNDAKTKIAAQIQANKPIVQAHKENVEKQKKQYEEDKAAYLAEYEAKKTQYAKDLAAWNKANPNANAVQLAEHPDTSTENFTGGEANWNQAHIGTHTANTVFESIKNDTALANHGLSIATDSSQIEDLDVKVTKILDKMGEEKFELKFKLTSAYGKAFEQILKADSTVTQSTGIKPAKLVKDEETGLFKEQGEHHSLTDSGTRYIYTDKDTGAKVEFQKASSDELNSSTNNNSVRILMSTDQDSADYQKILENMAVHATPATEGDIKVLAENRLMAAFADQIDPRKNLSGEQRTKKLKEVQEQWGLTVDDLMFTTDPNGRVKFFIADNKMDNIVKKTGITHFTHGVHGSGTGLVDRIVNMITGANPGLLSTYHRNSQGINNTGMSSDADMAYGSGDYVYLRGQKSDIPKNASYGDSIIVDAKSVLRRLDLWANTGDSFGKRSNSSKGAFNTMTGYLSGSNEVMTKDSLPISAFNHINIGHEDYKNQIVEKLKKMGILQINGIPIEEFIVTNGQLVPPRNDPNTYVPTINLNS